MTFNPSIRHALLAASLSLSVICSNANAQQKPSTDKPAEDVVRVSTELVQTAVMVFDKQSRFVEDLKPEQFELRIDGSLVPLSFVERVIAGTAEEQKLIETSARTTRAGAASTTTYRGRTIIFFIDDLHLSAESTQRTRKTILEFVENQMAPGDQVAIASPSGQIGFLQQFTDVVPVLRAALARLNHRPYTVRDSENIPMTEYTAVQISQGDKYALEYYSSELLKATNFNAGGGLGPPRSGPFGGRPGNAGQTPGITRDVAERLVRERAQLLLKQSALITNSTLSSLESLMKTSSQMAGNKVVFFISDGFYLNDRETGAGDKLKQITDAATRAGVVVYTVDARGMVSMTDAMSNRADPAGLVSRSNVGEIAASQDALTMLADDTGGRAALNTGALASLVKDALKETSNYYLLGWKPRSEQQKARGYKRVEVSIVGRPDLTARLPRGFILGGASETASIESKAPAGTLAAAAKMTDAELRAALGATAPKRGLPTTLTTGFLDVPGLGLVLTTSMQMATDVLGYGADGKQAAAIDIAGIVLNDQGKQAGGFKTRINVNPRANATGGNPGVIYNHKLPLPPGLYQVRVAARDDNIGRVGSATQWVEVPDLGSKKLMLSSLMIGGQFIGSGQKTAVAQQEQVQFSVDRRFAKGAHLNFLTIIYNAARGTGGFPELQAQIKISRAGQAIVTSPLRQVAFETGADAARIPYGADIALQTLPVGRYLLQVTVTDRVAKTSASQQVSFEIE